MALRHILSIDGGGVRGLVPAIVLDALDAEFKAIGKGCRVADCFDLIAGTSVGSIIAAGLALPLGEDDGGLRPGELRRLFETEASRIFPRRFWTNIPLVGALVQLFGPLYQPDGLNAVLESQLGDAVFADAKRNILIPAYSIDPRGAVLFRGGPAYAAREEHDRFGQVRVVDAVIGSAAAPTFFPPHPIAGAGGQRWTAVDGGVYVNDPAMVAVAEAARLFPGDDLRVISLGTGRQTRDYPFEEARGWGFSEWISPKGRFRTPLLSVIQDGQARAVHRQLKYLLDKDYFRFDYRLEAGRGSDRLDDASSKNLARLTRGALEMVEEKRPMLRQLAQELEAVHPATV
ncbi:MAG: patatin-like phospholipase family protein [Pseudomonadota bacterium]